MTPAKPLSKILAEAGAGFVLVRRPGEQYRNFDGDLVTATGKEALGAGWQRTPRRINEALAHARRGGNVGMLGGHNGLVLIDIDQDRAGALAIWPELADTLELYRDTAPERAKFVVRIVGALPPSAKDHDSGTEILASGTQGVVAGVHQSGARIQHRGERIIDVTADQVATFWRRRTGKEIGAGRSHDDAGPPDAEAVQRSMALADKVLDLAGVQGSGWRAYGDGGRKIVLQQCPFNPADDPHVEDRSAAVVIGADGRIGATCHHARCQARIQAHDGGGWALLKSIAGFRPEVERQNNLALVEALREHVQTLDFAEYVPIALQSATGYRTLTTDVRAAEAVLRIAALHGRLEDLPISLRKLRGGMGVGSTNTAGAALKRLAGWFVVPLDADADSDVTNARRWSIAPHLRAWASETVRFDEVAQIARVVTDLRGSLPGEGKRAIYATSPLATQLARDAFSSVQTPITRTELDVRIEVRDAEIAALKAIGAPADAIPKRINPRRYRRRLAATLPSAGPAVLLVINALELHGGTLTRHQLRELTHLGKCALSRAVSRGIELDLLDSAGRHLVHLADDWRQQVDRKEGQMPTAGRRLERAISDVDAGLRWLERNVHRPDLTAEQRQQMERRQAKLAARKQRLVKERFGLDIDAETGGKAPASRRRFEAWVAGREAAKYDAKETLQELGRQFADADDRKKAEAQALRAGWTPGEFAYAWRRYHPTPGVKLSAADMLATADYSHLTELDPQVQMALGVQS